MASLKAVERHRGGIIKLGKLPEEVWQLLVESLQNTPISLDPDEYAVAAVVALKDIPPDDATEVAQALTTLCGGRAVRSVDSTADFVDDILETVEEGSTEKIEVEILRDRLTQILDIESMVVSSRAASIMFEHGHLFATAKVLSDVRPVFGLNIEEAPKTAIIFHNLSIHYFQDGQHKEFFVVLDTDEVESLIETLERAVTKAETLKSMLSAANIPYIETE
jgi:hypothetical protein